MRRAAATALALAGLVGWPGGAAAKAPLGPGERVDLNRATAAELMRLPEVGRKRAEDILELRARRPLRRVEDVTAVKGISTKWVARHRALLSVGEARPAGAAVHAHLDHPTALR